MEAGVSLSLSRDGVHGESICSSFIFSLISDPVPRELGLFQFSSLRYLEEIDYLVHEKDPHSGFRSHFVLPTALKRVPLFSSRGDGALSLILGSLDADPVVYERNKGPLLTAGHRGTDSSGARDPKDDNTADAITDAADAAQDVAAFGLIADPGATDFLGTALQRSNPERYEDAVRPKIRAISGYGLGVLCIVDVSYTFSIADSGAVVQQGSAHRSSVPFRSEHGESLLGFRGGDFLSFRLVAGSVKRILGMSNEALLVSASSDAVIDAVAVGYGVADAVDPNAIFSYLERLGQQGVSSSSVFPLAIGKSSSLDLHMKEPISTGHRFAAGLSTDLGFDLRVFIGRGSLPIYRFTGCDVASSGDDGAGSVSNDDGNGVENVDAGDGAGSADAGAGVVPDLWDPFLVQTDQVGTPAPMLKLADGRAKPNAL